MTILKIKNHIKKLLRKILAFLTNINPRIVTILNPGLIHYRIFKVTYGFPNLLLKIRKPETKKLKKNKILITERNEYFEYYWKLFDNYMKNPKKEKEVTRKGYTTRLHFFNYENQTEMRELTEVEIGKIKVYFQPWIDILEEYFKCPVSILNIRSWRDHIGAKFNTHFDGLPYGTMKIMLYRGESSLEKGTIHININKKKTIPLIGENAVFIFDQNHLSHFLTPVKKGNRDCIELLVIADKRKRVVSAGNLAEYPANPFSDWTQKSTKIIRFNRWFHIGA